MRVSFIIPVKELNDYVLETVEHLQRLDGSDWEAFVVTNDEQEAPWTDERITIVASGRVGPADKRDLAAVSSTGEILVFLDDDSYPARDYLTVLRGLFSSGHEAVGGPALTPTDDTYWQQVSGAMNMSRLMGGAPERYSRHGVARSVQDWPSVNLAVRRSTFVCLGGFDCKFWPGEDTFLCDKLVGAGIKIWYCPDLLVWHHRRRSLSGHLKQVGGYGLHRGFFARRYRKSSMKAVYFAPSLLVLVIIGAFLLPSGPLRTSAAIMVFLYLVTQVAAAAELANRLSGPVAAGTVIYAPLSHVWYGIRFLQGILFTRELVSRLR